MQYQNNDEKYFLRDIVGEYMCELGAKDKRVMVVNADLIGASRNRKFTEMYPERSFNVGIAEQNMVCFSAGLAKEGFISYAFSMAPFLSMRACEQCRTDVAYANLNVRLMSTYAGVSGGISGATHWGIEDCGIMTSIPNITVIELSDPNQAIQIMDQTLSFNGPLYIRIGVEPVQKVYDDLYSHTIGCASIVQNGDDGAFIVCGITVKYAVEAAKRIKSEFGKCIQIIDMHTIKPIDRNSVISAAHTGNVIVAQDHNVYGGLGSMVAKVIAEENFNTKFRILGVNDEFVAMAHAPYLYHKFGYDGEGLYAAMTNMLGVK